jgi:hypothetical protein
VVRGPAHVDLEHGRLPDPEGQLIEELARKVEELEGQVRELKVEGVRSRESGVGR